MRREEVVISEGEEVLVEGGINKLSLKIKVESIVCRLPEEAHQDSRGEAVEVNSSSRRLKINKLLVSGSSLSSIRHKLAGKVLIKLNNSGKDSSSRDLLLNLVQVALKRGMFLGP